MTTENMKLARAGREFWWQYVQLNGFAMEPNREGLRKLAAELNLTISHLQRCINLYLEA